MGRRAVMVTVDAGLMGQVMSILVTNALHYTPAGGQIVVTTTDRDEIVTRAPLSGQS